MSHVRAERTEGIEPMLRVVILGRIAIARAIGIGHQDESNEAALVGRVLADGHRIEGDLTRGWQRTGKWE